MSTWLSGIIGQGIAANIGGTMHNRQQYAAQATQYGYAQNAAQQQAMNMSQGQMAASPAGFGAGGFGQVYEPIKYMIDGKSMNFEEFINTIYPEDCAEKTMLILRLKKED